MGKTRDHFKKIKDTKGTFHAKMGTIKDRNSMDLTEVEDIKKRWQEYTEELYKKDLHEQDNHDGMIRHTIYRCLVEPDILECEVKCNPKDCIVHGILQARILEWAAFPFSRGSSQPRD